MRRGISLALVVSMVTGCGGGLRHVAVDRVPLGKVVVYRNGVAFYERRARVVGGQVRVRVPRERVDDFLKSLTVVDARSGRPLPVTFPRRQAADAPVIEMALDVGAGAAEVVMTYITDAAAWKPSYRLVLGDDDAAMLESWAVVDNQSGEDWNDVAVGVGASAAMSFRYDLWSVRTVDRATLAQDEVFAVAPPTAVSPYGGDGGAVAAATPLITLDAAEIRGAGAGAPALAPAPAPVAAPVPAPAPSPSPVAVAPAVIPQPGGGTATTGAIQGRVTDTIAGDALSGVTVAVTGPSGSSTAITEDDGSYRVTGLAPGDYQMTFYFGDVTVARSGIRVGVNKTTPVFQKINPETAVRETIVVEDRPPAIDPTSTTQGITIDQEYTRNIPVPGRTFGATLGTAPGRGDDEAPRSPPPPPPDPYAQVRLGDQKLKEVAAGLIKDRRPVVVQGFAAPGELAPERAALARANLVRNQLIDAGVAPARVGVASAGVGARAMVQIVAGTAGRAETAAATSPRADVSADAPPIGESLFAAPTTVRVADGQSAMVSVLRAPTTGREVYLYDGDGERGNARFAFKSVRVANPTGATLEAGPITVYGAGRYVGEGLADAIAPHAAAVVPYALDRQIVVARERGTADELARLTAVARGVATAEVQHLRTTTLTITSRLRTPTTVYVRHPVEAGWTLLEPGVPSERDGDHVLLAVELGAGATRTLALREATPMIRRLAFTDEAAVGELRLFVDSGRASGALRQQLAAFLAAHAALIDAIERAAGLRDRAAEYRARQAELMDQLVALRKLKSAAVLSRTLAVKLDDIATRLQETTLAITTADDAVTLRRVDLADAIALVHLDDALAAR